MGRIILTFVQVVYLIKLQLNQTDNLFLNDIFCHQLHKQEQSDSKQLTMNLTNSTNNSEHCVPLVTYQPFEQYYYLFCMCPIAIIGIVLNIVSWKVFNADSFRGTVIFKYLRIITKIDLFICILVFGYCILMYTPAINYHDLYYVRHSYLAYIFIPLANFSINLRFISSYINRYQTIFNSFSRIHYLPFKYVLQSVGDN